MTTGTLFLDWLRFSIPVDIPNFETLPPLDVFGHSGEILTPFPNYTNALGLLCGRIDWNEERPEQRRLVTLTGDDLLRMRRYGVTDRTVCQWIDANDDLNVPRLDIAVDTSEPSVTPDMLYQAWLTNDLATRAKKVTRLHAADEHGASLGYTVYVGSRHSEAFMRVYDKRAEQIARGKAVNGDKPWTRVELELKGGKARRAVRHIAEHGMQTAGPIIAQFLDWPANLVWQDLMRGDHDVDMTIGRKETDHETWLRRVVFPNFERALKDKNPIAERIVQQAIVDLI